MARQEGQPPPQHQDSQPGRQEPMRPQPSETRPGYRGSGKLRGKVALITGGDSGIGRAVAVLYAREGARIGILYLSEDADGQETRRLVEMEGQPCTLLRGDAGQEDTCRGAVGRMIAEHGRLDILVNNAAEQHPQDSIEDITAEQLERTFRTDIFAQFFLVKAALPHLTAGACIINTASEMAEFGGNVPIKRAGQPDEVAPAYVFLASEGSSYMAGQVLHPNGGNVVNG